MTEEPDATDSTCLGEPDAASRGQGGSPPLLAMRVPRPGPGLLGPLLLPLLLAGGCGALSFQLPAQTRKCLKEEMHRDVMVTGEYEVSEAGAPGARTDLRVRAPRDSPPHPRTLPPHG